MHALNQALKSPHVFLLLILSWAVCLWVHLALIQEITNHELGKYWPGISLATIYQDPHLLENIESNGILVQLFYRLIWFGEDTHCDALTLRLPVMICSLISLILIYRLGKSLDGYRLGLCATFVLATNTLQTGFAVHCRFYAFNTVMVILSTMLLLKMCQDEHPRWKWLYMLSLLGCICTMILSVFIVVPHLLYFIFTSRSRLRALKQAFLITLAIAICFVYLIIRDSQAINRFNYNSSLKLSFNTCTCTLLGHGCSLLGHGCSILGHGRSLLNKSTLFGIFKLYDLLGNSLGSFQLDALFGNNKEYWLVYLLRAIQINGAFLGAIFLALLYDCLRRHQLTPRFLFVFTFLMIYALMVLESATIKIILIPPNLSPLIPFYAMTMALGLKPRPVRIFMLLCLLLGSHVLCNGTIIDNEGPGKLVRIMRAHMQPGDTALIISDKNTYQFLPEASTIIHNKELSPLAAINRYVTNSYPPGSKILISPSSLYGSAFLLLDHPHAHTRLWFLDKRDDSLPTANLYRFYKAYNDGRCTILMRSNKQYDLYLIRFSNPSSPAPKRPGH